jgi:predicted nucleic acid-binding protein
MSSSIEPGTTIFIDANILMYAISGHWKYGRSSKHLLDAINSGDYEGLTSVLVCSEIFHKSILAEIVEKQKISPGYALRSLKEDPRMIKDSKKAWSVIKSVKDIKHLKVTGIREDALELALDYSKKYCLLSNDALHLATMKLEDVIYMASNDGDFGRVEWINLWKP